MIYEIKPCLISQGWREVILSWCHLRLHPCLKPLRSLAQSGKKTAMIIKVSSFFKVKIQKINSPDQANIGVYLFLLSCSLSRRRLSLVLHFSHWQWRAGVRALGRQHHLGWPGDGPPARTPCSHTGPQWWEHNFRYIQRRHAIRLHVLQLLCFF